MNALDLIHNFYVREFETHPRKKMVLFFVLFVFNLILVGFFGIIRGYGSIREKQALKRQYKEVSLNLAKNIKKADALEPFVTDNKAVDYVNYAIPSEPETQIFLEEFVQVASKSGFVVDSFKASRVTGENELEISIKLHGDGARIVDLVESSERMKRLTSVSRIDVTSSDTESTALSGLVKVDLVVVVYKVEKS